MVPLLKLAGRYEVYVSAPVQIARYRRKQADLLLPLMFKMAVILWNLIYTITLQALPLFAPLKGINSAHKNEIKINKRSNNCCNRV